MEEYESLKTFIYEAPPVFLEMVNLEPNNKLDVPVEQGDFHCKRDGGNFCGQEWKIGWICIYPLHTITTTKVQWPELP